MMMAAVAKKRPIGPHSPRVGALPRAKIMAPIHKGKLGQIHWGRFAFQMPIRVRLLILTSHHKNMLPSTSGLNKTCPRGINQELHFPFRVQNTLRLMSRPPRARKPLQDEWLPATVHSLSGKRYRLKLRNPSG